MITNRQKKWLKHLSIFYKTVIIPYNPDTIKVFQKIASELKEILTQDTPIFHKGASSLGISGKGEIDVYIPVQRENFYSHLEKLKKVYGNPGSHYPYERARFNIKRDNIRAEIFLIIKNTVGWKQLIIFENWLTTHPKDLNDYEKLKESLHGSSTQEYYTRKLEFFNSIIKKAS